jgi:hypothetical protein
MNQRFHYLLVVILFLCAGKEAIAGAAAATKPDSVPTASTASSAGSARGAGSPTPAQKPKVLTGSISPPFGLRWGESKEDVASQMAKAGAEILKRPNVGDREVLAIEGINQPSLRQTIAYFDAKKNLVEVELQYGDSQWTFDAYRAFVVSVTRRLQAYYGEPSVLERDRRPQGNGVETIAGYQWQQEDSSGVLLFFFSVEQGKNSYTTVSVHYRAELPQAPPPQTPVPASTPENSPIPDKSGKKHPVK